MSTHRALGLALATALSASALAGCSQGDDKKKEAPAAKDAITKSQDTVKKYAGLSLKVKGKVDGDDANLTAFGDEKGTEQEVKGALDNEPVNMIYVDNKQYLKASKKFYQKSGMPSSTIDEVADKWVMGKATGTRQPDLIIPEFITDYTDDSNTTVKALLDTKEKVTEEKVGDRDTWKIVSSDKKTTVWVSADDKYDIVKCLNFKSKALGLKGESGEPPVDFFDQGKTHDVKAPEGAKDVADLAK